MPYPSLDNWLLVCRGSAHPLSSEKPCLRWLLQLSPLLNCTCQAAQWLFSCLSPLQPEPYEGRAWVYLVYLQSSHG